MSRVGLIVAATAVMGVTLAGCSGSLPSWPDWMSPSMPDWLSSTPSPPPAQSLQFESEPPGADVRTAQGQTCQTPCALTVPSENQAVTFAKEGFLPQTVQVSVGPPRDHSVFERAPPPTLTPNPVEVALQVATPPKAARKPKPRKTVSSTTTPRPAPAATQQTPGSLFPPPPRIQ